MRLKTVGLLVGLVTVLSGCGAQDITGPTTEVTTFSGSVPKTYSSLEALLEDASIVATGRVVNSEVVKIADLEVTKHQLSITANLHGESADVVDVYQTGTADWVFDLPLPDHLEVGETYLLFLTSMGLPKDQPASDGYAVVGPAAWRQVGVDFVAVNNSAQPIDFGSIPQKFAVSEAESLLRD